MNRLAFNRPGCECSSCEFGDSSDRCLGMLVDDEREPDEPEMTARQEREVANAEFGGVDIRDSRV